MPWLRASSLRSGFSLLLCLAAPCHAQAVNGDTCTRLLEVEIAGSEIIPPHRQQALVAPFLGACIDAATTGKLLAALSDTLIASGYVTSRPYLVEQDVADGQLEIRILEGRIEAFVDAASGESDRRIAAAFLFTGEILNLRELETGLEALQRVASVDASLEIRPGRSAGGSIVAIERRETRPMRFEIGANARTDLDDQLGFLFNLDNPLDINDILQLRINDGALRGLLQSNRSRELAYSFGLGAYQFEAQHGEIDYRQRLQGIDGSFVAEGKSIVDLLGYRQTLLRGRASRLTLAVSLKLEDTRNFLENVEIEISSYRTSQLRLGLRHDWYHPWGQWSNEVTYHRGLDAFGARDDEFFENLDGAGNPGRLQFEKLVFESQWRYYLAAPDWYLDSRLHLQYSEDILFTADKLTLGSPLTVRGYAAALSGSNGGYLHGDITRQFRAAGVAPGAARALKSLALSFGLDYGEVGCEIDNPDICGNIYGAGIGLLVRDANFSAQLQWGRPLKRIADGIGDHDLWLLDLRWSV